MIQLTCSNTGWWSSLFLCPTEAETHWVQAKKAAKCVDDALRAAATASTDKGVEVREAGTSLATTIAQVRPILPELKHRDYYEAVEQGNPPRTNTRYHTDFSRWLRRNTAQIQ